MSTSLDTHLFIVCRQAASAAILKSFSSPLHSGHANGITIPGLFLSSEMCRSGETQPMESSSSEEDRLSDAEVQKVEEVAFRTAAAEASGNAQEARVIKDAAQPTPRQVRLVLCCRTFGPTSPFFRLSVGAPLPCP